MNELPLTRIWQSRWRAKPNKHPLRSKGNLDVTLHTVWNHCTNSSLYQFLFSVTKIRLIRVNLFFPKQCPHHHRLHAGFQPFRRGREAFGAKKYIKAMKGRLTMLKDSQFFLESQSHEWKLRCIEHKVQY